MWPTSTLGAQVVMLSQLRSLVALEQNKQGEAESGEMSTTVTPARCKIIGAVPPPLLIVPLHPT